MAALNGVLILCLCAAVLGEESLKRGPPLTSFGHHYHVKITQSRWPTYKKVHLEHWHDSSYGLSRTDHVKGSVTELKTYQFRDQGLFGTFYTVDPIGKCWELQGTRLHPVHVQHGLPADLSDFKYVGNSIIDHVPTAKYVKYDEGYLFTIKETLWVTFQKKHIWGDQIEAVPVKHRVRKALGFVEFTLSTSYYSGYSSDKIDPDVFRTPADCVLLNGIEGEISPLLARSALEDDEN